MMLVIFTSRFLGFLALVLCIFYNISRLVSVFSVENYVVILQRYFSIFISVLLLILQC